MGLRATSSARPTILPFALISAARRGTMRGFRTSIRYQQAVRQGVSVLQHILLLLLLNVAASGAEPVPLPKDTLPAELSLTSVPLGLDIERPVPKDNPLTEGKVRLGRKLFF